MPVHKLLAEAFGTFCLVFAGTGAVVIDAVTGGGVTHVGIALTFGLVVLAMIYAIGDVSGCHLNPAVTVGLCAAGRFPAALVLPYSTAQIAGGLVASLALRLLFPTSPTLGTTIPAGSDLQSFGLECILTLVLMVVILGVSSGGREKILFAGVAIGAVIALEALFAGPISGASMNPARSLAPAIVSLRFDSLWIYLVAPVLGSLGGVLVWRGLHDNAHRDAQPAGEPR